MRLVDYNPIKGQVKKNSLKRRERYLEDWKLVEAFKVAPPMLKACIKLKLLTGLRRSNLLRLTESNQPDDGIHDQPSKTSKSSGVRLIIEWTDELRKAVEDALAVRKKSTVPWLFCTFLGYPYINEKGKANGFDSLWQRKH